MAEEVAKDADAAKEVAKAADEEKIAKKVAKDAEAAKAAEEVAKAADEEDIAKEVAKAAKDADAKKKKDEDVAKERVRYDLFWGSVEGTPRTLRKMPKSEAGFSEDFNDFLDACIACEIGISHNIGGGERQGIVEIDTTSEGSIAEAEVYVEIETSRTEDGGRAPGQVDEEGCDGRRQRGEEEGGGREKARSTSSPGDHQRCHPRLCQGSPLLVTKAVETLKKYQLSANEALKDLITNKAPSITEVSDMAADAAKVKKHKIR